MIYYFSGTGNSKYVAESLGRLLSDEVKFIPSTDAESERYNGKGLGFIFPVYSWGIPPLVEKFMKELPDSLFTDLSIDQGNVWCVMVCGDETGLTPEMVKKIMGMRGVKIQLLRSIIMPNNYVLLPGFDTDSKEVEKKKIDASVDTLLQIADEIVSGRMVEDVNVGGLAWVKSRLIYPLFKKWGIFPGKWHAKDNCIGCGRCEKVCPLHNIKMNTHKPEWGSRCCSCLGCYHICPVHAVEYGKATAKKGQYFFRP